MSENTSVREFDINARRTGFAGMHDLIDGENINRILKQKEKLEKFQSIYLDPPSSYKRGSHKMLLVQGPHDGREGAPLFPLGLGYIARVLNDIGVQVEVLDAHAEKYTPEETLEAVKKKDFDLVGITALSTQYGFVKWVSKEIKAFHPKAKIVLGAQLAHYNPHTVIDHTAVDICVIGEGEITIQDVIYNLDDLSGVAGIGYRTPEGRYQRNLDRPRIHNLEAIPFPLWKPFNMEHYFVAGFLGGRAHRATHVLSSRGCPYSCTFCSLSFPNVTYRSVDNVIAEIKHHMEHFGVDGVTFADELFVIDKKRVYEFCDKLKPLGITWGCQGRANIVNGDEKMLRAMKDAGAAYIGFGLESATSEILKKMQKKTTVEQNKNCMIAAQKVGLTPIAQYMFGFPGETLESIKDGVEFFKDVKYCPPCGLYGDPHISITTALPGSQLYEDCKKTGLIKDEDEYLTRITRGYFYNEAVVVNLTSFSDDELFDLKYAAQEAMRKNYLEALRRENRFFMLRHRLHHLRDLYYIFGPMYLVRKISKALLKIAVGALRGQLDQTRIWRDIASQNRNDYAQIYRTPRAKEFREFMQK